MDSDLFVHLDECSRGAIATPVRRRDEAAVAVWLAVDGYPAAPRFGDSISGLDVASAIPGVEVFVAGMSEVEGGLVTSGGRVVCVTATGGELRLAVDRAYAGADAIHFDGVHYRRDIAAQGLP
jgi:phosphoribosylamine--glycine ligase